MANVLVIDDDEDITRFLETQLTEEGHQVVVAHQGDEGMAKAIKGTPDLIMLDVFLPDSTGYQICSQIRKNAATHAVPIIMMTGAARFPNQQQFGLERGANEYITKPFNVIEVDKLISKYIGPNRSDPRQSAKSEQRMAPIMEETSPAETEIKQPDASDDLAALSAFLEQSLAKKKAAAEAAESDMEPRMPNRPSEAVGNGVVKISFMIPPPSSQQSMEPVPPLKSPWESIKNSMSTANDDHGPMRPMSNESPLEGLMEQPAPLRTPSEISRFYERPVNPAQELYVPSILASKERFVDFGLDIFALASRLCSTHAEKHLAEQLLRAGLSVGARLTETRSAGSKEEFLALLQDAQKDLRDTAYWLMIAQKAGLLKELGKTDLEKTCQSLTTLLNDFAKSQTQK